MAKTAKSNGNGTRLIAPDSRPRPADFALGSVESRAAARAMLQTSRQLSAYDADCLTIYCMMPYIHAGVDPDYQVLEPTEVYKRGNEVYDRLYGPDLPLHLEPKSEYDECRIASLLFSQVNGRQPGSGDTLRYEEVAESLRNEEFREVEEFEHAWARRLPNLPCPLKFENGRLYCRSASSKPIGAWAENHLGDPRCSWSSIEREISGIPTTWDTEFNPDWRPAISAVTFVKGEDGMLRAEPVEV